MMQDMVDALPKRKRKPKPEYRMSDLIARLEGAYNTVFERSLAREAAAALRQKDQEIAELRETCRTYVTMYEAEMERSKARSAQLSALRDQQPVARMEQAERLISDVMFSFDQSTMPRALRRRMQRFLDTRPLYAHPSCVSPDQPKQQQGDTSCVSQDQP